MIDHKLPHQTFVDRTFRNSIRTAEGVLCAVVFLIEAQQIPVKGLKVATFFWSHVFFDDILRFPGCSADSWMAGMELCQLKLGQNSCAESTDRSKIHPQKH